MTMGLGLMTFARVSENPTCIGIKHFSPSGRGRRMPMRRLKYTQHFLRFGLTQSSVEPPSGESVSQAAVAIKDKLDEFGLDEFLQVRPSVVAHQKLSGPIFFEYVLEQFVIFHHGYSARSAPTQTVKTFKSWSEVIS